MNPIKLTEEHKTKLLEMCKILFPEYTTIPNDKNPKFLTINWFTKQGYFIHLMDDYDLKENKMIHWFEFCMTHLIEKLFNSFEEDDEEFYNRYINNGASFYGIGVNEIIFVMLSSQKHPVDYLYEEFKKLKS